MDSTRRLVLPAFFCLSLLGGADLRSRAGESLETGFRAPPPEARPWVYWFWLNGNVTKEGITADLEAMQRVGIGGVLIMEVDQGAPVGPVGFMSDAWRELFRHVVAEADRLGLEVNMNNDAGWNGSGGPWIQPEQSMQKVVWSEVELTGPQRFDAVLQQPETVAGFYRDLAVLAFPSPGDYRIENIKAKAGYEVAHCGPPAQKELAAEMAIDRSAIVDLSQRLDRQGRLAWEVPPGRWTVLRFGHTSTGVQNAPAPASGRGLECDKLSPEGVAANFAGMMGPLIADVRSFAGKSLVATHVDSWENGAQNWTATMRQEFEKRRGYDLWPYLPAMTGRVVSSLEISERFLWDLRKTISELVVENYAGHLQQLAHQHGLRFTIEAYGSPCDCLPYAGQCDEPMGEFWVGGGALNTCKGMASSAHAYGKRIVGAEAFTAADQERWRDHPATIKALGDQAFCEGINRFVFHRYAMQPWLDRRPGMTMGPWGVHYERTQTWWEWTPDWHRYLARCQFLLRQGTFVADICYLESEDSPQGFSDHPRNGYDWDQCSPEVVLTRMSVRDGRLVLPDGMTYRLLVLPPTRSMTPRLLRRIQELVRDGATIVGPRPQRSPSLMKYPECDAEVQQLADELWGPCDGQKVLEHRFGRGRVLWGATPEKALAQDGVRADFSSPDRLRAIHRHAEGTDIYFVANPLPQQVITTASFRVAGKRPELWWPDSGRVERAAAFDEHDGVTSILLPFGPSGSVFVVFREAAGPDQRVTKIVHGGRPIFDAGPQASRITVLQAAYGVPGDPQRTRDVRDRVQAIVDGGENSVNVSDLARGDDPAQNVVKTLTVEYLIGERRLAVKGQDGTTVQLAPDAVAITVLKAQYGILDDPQRTRDVRDRIQRLADAGVSSFPVARMAEGDDPAFLVVKTLVLEYLIQGERVTAVGKDPDTIVLALPPESQRVADLQRADDGRLRLVAWSPGVYELTTAAGKVRREEIGVVPDPLTLEGPWNLQFPPGCGPPEQVSLERLASWSDHPDANIKYFSGTATYRTSFRFAQPARADHQQIDLDLGRVQAMAEVTLNGRNFGVLWKPPFRVDITNAVAAGENQLQVRVTNLWPNRLIGDEQLPEDSSRNPDGTLKEWPKWLAEGRPSPTGRRTFTTWRLWAKDSPLLESGLLGPVVIRTAVIRDVN